MIETIILVGLVTIGYVIVFLIGVFTTTLAGQRLIKDGRFWMIVGISGIFICLFSAIAAIDFYRKGQVGALFLPIGAVFVGGYSMMRVGAEMRATQPPRRKKGGSVVNQVNQIFFDW